MQKPSWRGEGSAPVAAGDAATASKELRDFEPGFCGASLRLSQRVPVLALIRGGTRRRCPLLKLAGWFPCGRAGRALAAAKPGSGQPPAKSAGEPAKPGPATPERASGTAGRRPAAGNAAPVFWAFGPGGQSTGSLGGETLVNSKKCRISAGCGSDHGSPNG